jgi:hypothetical protein
MLIERQITLGLLTATISAFSLGCSNGGVAGSPMMTGGQKGTAGAEGQGGTGGIPNVHPDPVFPPEPAKGTPGVWEEVTPPGVDLADGFGLGNVVADPVHPNEIYVGGYGEIYKSVDYGLTWAKLDSKPKPPELALGHVIAVAGTTPPTLYVANVRGPQFLYRSRDGGATFALTGSVAEEPEAESFYSLEVDPNDPDHLITGLHEEDGVLESTDGGDTWRFVNRGTGWIKGISWFIYFVKSDDAAATRKTWFAIAQSGGSGMITRDGGQTWAVCPGLAKLEHPHGGGSLFQYKNSLFVAGIYGADGSGVFRSTDLGKSFTRVFDGNTAIVWGSAKKVYTAWGWACANCDAGPDGPQFKTAEQPGNTWTAMTTPARLNWGPNSVATTTDGTKTIYIGSMWATGMWRYVEP